MFHFCTFHHKSSPSIWLYFLGQRMLMTLLTAFTCRFIRLSQLLAHIQWIMNVWEFNYVGSCLFWCINDEKGCVFWTEHGPFLRIPGVTKKAERSIFVTLIFKNIAFFYYHQIKKKFWKEWYQDNKNWLSSFDSMVIYQHAVIFNFLFILVTFQSGILAFLTSIILYRCPETHWSVQTKQRENLWTAIPAVNSSRTLILTKFVNDCVSRNGCRINTTEPNQMILVSFSSKDNALSDEIKIWPLSWQKKV